MLTQAQTIRNALLHIEEMIQQPETLSRAEKRMVYNMVEGFIFQQIGRETFIGPEQLTDLQSIEELKCMIEPAATEQRELYDYEEEIIRSNAKSLLLALGFK